MGLGIYVIVFALIREGELEAGQTRGYEWLFQIIAALVVAIGACFILQGCLGVAAGIGTLLRKQWGRVLAFVVAVLSGLWGFLFVFGSDQDVKSITWGAVHLGYAILTLVLLIKNGAAFTRRQFERGL